MHVEELPQQVEKRRMVHEGFLYAHLSSAWVPCNG